MQIEYLILIGTVAAVGVLHTMVPDHWLPIALIARQRKWSKAETALVALKAGTGHVLSTLALAVVFWFAGVVIASRYGQIVDMLASLALVGFGLWVAVSAWIEMHQGHTENHEHGELSKTTALLFILGSSPMIEGIPAFFAAARYGFGLMLVMAIVFAVSTIATYIVLSTYVGAGLQRVGLGAFEAYGEIASGLLIAAVGIVFWVFPLN